MVKVRSDFPAAGHAKIAALLHHVPGGGHGGRGAALLQAKASPGAADDSAIHEQPIPLYTLKIPVGENEAALTQVRHYGWRYLIHHAATGTHRTADVDQGTDGQTTLLNLTESTPAARAALDDFVAAAQAAGQDGELRWLEIPALYLSLLWLHGADGGTADRFLDMRSFQEKSADAVAQLLAQPGAPPGGGLPPAP